MNNMVSIHAIVAYRPSVVNKGMQSNVIWQNKLRKKISCLFVLISAIRDIASTQRTWSFFLIIWSNPSHFVPYNISHIFEDV